MISSVAFTYWEWYGQFVYRNTMIAKKKSTENHIGKMMVPNYGHFSQVCTGICTSHDIFYCFKWWFTILGISVRCAQSICSAWRCLHWFEITVSKSGHFSQVCTSDLYSIMMSSLVWNYGFQIRTFQSSLHYNDLYSIMMSSLVWTYGFQIRAFQSSVHMGLQMQYCTLSNWTVHY